jgi:hypothetical protein
VRYIVSTCEGGDNGINFKVQWTSRRAWHRACCGYISHVKRRRGRCNVGSVITRNSRRTGTGRPGAGFWFLQFSEDLIKGSEELAQTWQRESV